MAKKNEEVTSLSAGSSDPRSPEAEARRRAFQRILDERNITPAELARRAGLKNANLIYNFLNGRAASMSMRTIQRIINALPGLTLNDFVDPNRERAIPPISAISMAFIKGKVEAGAFEANPEYPPYMQKAIPAPYQGDPPVGLYALEVKGEDNYYGEGCILFCVPYKQYSKKLDDGRGVIVHRYRDGLIEATAQVYRVRGGAPYLEYGNKKIVIPVDYNGGLIDLNGDKIEVAAVIVGSYLQEE